jgi:hypothetical protein
VRRKQNPEGNRPLGRPKLMWEGNIKMGTTHWIDLAQDRDRWRALVNTVKEPSGSIKFWEMIK